MRVFRFLIDAAKNSMNRRAAPSPASAITAGTASKEAVDPTARDPDFGTNAFMPDSLP
jgi:hypothetical protein